MLFIIVHQAYELWFKQILHELDRIQPDFEREIGRRRRLGRIVHGLDRIDEILKLLIQQLDVLETMTPLDFLDFRDLLMPASGFQSVQFRAIETRLGLQREGRLLFDERAFDDRLSSERDRARLADTEKQAEADRAARPLARPHAVRRDWAATRSARPIARRSSRCCADDAARVRASPVLTRRAAQGRSRRDRGRARTSSTRSSSRRSAKSSWRMSLAAVQAALFITVYRDEPVLQLPFRLLTALMDIEEIADALALPPRPDGAAHDRREDRHRRLVRPRLSAPHRRTRIGSSPTCSSSRPT